MLLDEIIRKFEEEGKAVVINDGKIIGFTEAE